MIDLNEVFAEAFVEALAPLVSRITRLEATVDRVFDRIEVLEDLLELEVEQRFVEVAPGEYERTGPCGVYPPQDDLFPGQQWSPCDLPFEHDGAHNCGLVP